MKRIISTFSLCLMLALTVSAQEKPKGRFDAGKFDAELQQFITSEASLTPQESAAFFPLYREMQKKQRAIFERQKQQSRVKPADEKSCEKAIKQRDENDLEVKRIQQVYHNKMLSVVSPSKLYDILKAEDRFHRQKLRNLSHGKQPKKALNQP